MLQTITSSESYIFLAVFVVLGLVALIYLLSPMSLPDDSDQTQTPEHTPAYDNGFGPNADKLGHILRFSTKATEKCMAELNALSAGLVGLRGPGGEQVEKIRTITEEFVKQVTDFTSGILASHEMMPVLSVTIVEAYLKDVLIYAAGVDSTLMERSKQTMTYQDALNAKSIEELKLEFRPKWARSFVDNGGPTKWIKRLKRWGARGYHPETVSQMETLWDVRHLIVHSAGIANPEFVQRHPQLNAQVGKRFIVSNAHFKPWLLAIYDFVEVTDHYFLQRCKKSPKLLPNADICSQCGASVRADPSSAELDRLAMTCQMQQLSDEKGEH